MNKQIGKAIRRMRKAKGLTVMELQRMIDAGDGQVYRWERGEYAPSAYFLCRMADALECSVDELLGRESLVRCVNCGKCTEKDMFGQKVILECADTEMDTRPDGYCFRGRKKED